MQEITLLPIPNQRLQFVVSDNRWDVTIKEARGVMVCDVIKNDDVLIRGVRAQADSPVIPYPHLSTDGNLAFITEGDEYPRWEAFGSTQSLVFWGPDD